METTGAVYGLIKGGRYEEAVGYLEGRRWSRAGVSLLGWLYYALGRYDEAGGCYEELAKKYGESYGISWALSLFKAGRFLEAERALNRVEDSEAAQNLRAAIKYEMDDLSGCRSVLPQMDDPDTLQNLGAVFYKEGEFEKALKLFEKASKSVNSLQLEFYKSLCFYQLEKYTESLKIVSFIIEKGVREHPELSVGSGTDGVETRSVGNSSTLQETFLIESFNLKFAIEFKLGNLTSAKEALTDMPPRDESELDAVSLHNKALIEEPSKSFEMFKFLLSNPPFPKETFGNVLLFHCIHGLHNVAADILAENQSLTYKFLSKELFDFLDAATMSKSSPENSYHKFENLTSQHIDQLRKLTKSIQDARLSRDNEAIKQSLQEYDKALEEYVPILMAQAKILWDSENFTAVEKLFRQSAEFCSEHKTWKLNVAHVFFVQDDKYKEAISYYEPIVNKFEGSVLKIPAIVLANLCVSYIMTSQNEQAEDLMRLIEKEEDKVTSSPCYHLCIVNLVIGTLYCAKGNYEFGISRVIKSLEPYEKKLGPDTWFYAKRCFLALAEHVAKHMLVLKEQVYDDIIAFLDACILHGENISSLISPSISDENPPDPHTKTVAYQAKHLKFIFWKLRDY